MHWFDARGRRIACWVGVALIVALQTGCAYRKAVDRGDDYAAQDNWKRALESYRTAKEKRPNSDEAAEKVRRARREAAERGLDRAARAIEEHRYRDADEELEYVSKIAPERERLGELREHARSEMASDIRDNVDAGEIDAAYRLHANFGTYFPEAERVRPPVSMIRRRALRQAEEFAAEGAYDEALARLEVVEKQDPGEVPQLPNRRERYRTAWADELARRASDHHSNGHAGGAALLWAKAYRVAGRDSDLESFRHTSAALEQTGRFSTSILPDETARRVRGFERSFVAAVSETGGVEVVDAEKVELQIDVDAEKPDCSVEKLQTERASKRYLAGTRQVANPAWERLERRLDRQRDDVEQLRREKGRAHHSWHHRRRRLKQFDRRHLGRLEESREDLEGDLREHENDLNRLEQRIDRAQRRVRELRRCDDCPRRRVRRAESRVDRLQDRLRREERKHREAEHELREKEREYRRLEQKFERVERQAREAREEYRRLERRLNRERDDARRLERRLDRTPRTKTEEIWRRFHYDVRTWRRRCERVLDVEISVAGEERGRTFTLRKSASTKDREHDAYAEYDIRRDPRRFDASEEQLVASVDEKLNAALVERFRSAYAGIVNDRMRTLVERAGDDPHRAADRLVARYLAAGDYLEEKTRRALDRLLSDQYGANLGAVGRLYGSE